MCFEVGIIIRKGKCILKFNIIKGFNKIKVNDYFYVLMFNKRERYMGIFYLKDTEIGSIYNW